MDRTQMLFEIKTNLIEMRNALARTLEGVSSPEVSDKIDDSSLEELHMASDLLLGAAKELVKGIDAVSNKAAETISGEKVA